jgi:transketolase
MILTKKNIIDDTARKAREISRKMAYCFPDYSEKIDIADINLFTALYYHELRHKPQEPQWEGRDRFIISGCGHCVHLLAVLAEIEYFGWNSAYQMVSRVEGDSSSLIVDIPGIHMVADSPFYAMMSVNGTALWSRTSQADFRVYAMLDSQNDPHFMEMIYSTARYTLDNVVSILRLVPGMSRGNVVHQWFTLGWHIEEVDYNDMESLFAAFSGASRTRGKPSVLIG